MPELNMRIGIVSIVVLVIASVHCIVTDKYITFRTLNMENNVISIFKYNKFHDSYLEDEYISFVNSYDEWKILRSSRRMSLAFCKLCLFASAISAIFAGLYDSKLLLIESYLGFYLSSCFVIGKTESHVLEWHEDNSLYCKMMQHLKNILQYIKKLVPMAPSVEPTNVYNKN
jgi:hypothetical protein